MTDSSKNQILDFSLTMVQKVLYGVLLFVVSLGVVFGASLLTALRGWGTVVFILLAILLGVVTFFISSGWTYKLKLTQRTVVIESRQEHYEIPLSRLGMLVRASSFPYPIIWLVLRNSTQGQEVPTKRVDPVTQEIIASYQARNPGMKITIMPVPVPFIRSGQDFVKTLKDRIPPLVVDERLGVK